MTFKPEDRVWWRLADGTIKRGAVVEAIDLGGESTRVKPDDERFDAIYLDAAELYQEIPAQDGIYSGIDDISYHADPDSFSSSGARALLSPSCPEIFDFERTQPPDPKPEYDFGHAAHFYVLGVGSVVEEIKFDNWKTNESQAARRQAWAAHRVPLLTKDVIKAKQMADALMKNPIARALFEAPGQAELSGYWTDPQTGLRLRFRPDWLCELDRITSVDYKTSTSAHPAHFAADAAKFGYHQQDPWYCDGLKACEITDDPDFLFVVQSKKPPFPATVNRIKPLHVELGRRLNRKAIDLYSKCSTTGEWPGYGDYINNIDLPSYAVYRQEEELKS